MKANKKRKILDAVLIFSMSVMATVITIHFNTPQVISLLLFFILPAAYLTYRIPWVFKKGIMPILASIPFTILVDYFAIKDGSWWVNTIFPFRLFNGIPIEDFIWTASWIYFVIVFYEYFVDQPRGGNDAPLNKRYKEFIAGWFGAAIVFLLFYNLIDKYLTIPYFYADITFGLGIIPLIIFIIKRPRILHKFSWVVISLFAINFLHEISALSTNQWYFPGKHFIGWLQIFNFRFPFEEFTMWMLLGSMYVLTWYEYFIDDGK